jgi:hypothetical protein
VINIPKNIGTKAETAVVRYLQMNGFPSAERRALRGTADAGDVTGTPGVCWEVKGGDMAKHASEAQVAAWLSDTDREIKNARADLGLLVMQRSGYGPDRCGYWWVALRWQYTASSTRLDLMGDFALRMTLETAVRWLRMNGYGDPLD